MSNLRCPICHRYYDEGCNCHDEEDVQMNDGNQEVEIKNGKGDVNTTRSFPFMLFQNKLDQPLTQDECKTLKGIGCDRALSIAVTDNKSPIIQPNASQKNFTIFVADVPLSEMVEITCVLAQTIVGQQSLPPHIRMAAQAFLQSVSGNQRPTSAQPPSGPAIL